MKRILIIMLSALCLYSCADNTKQEKNLLNDILKVHDKLMRNDEVLMKNKMKLDTLLKQKKDTVGVKEAVGKLSASEEAMEKWMMDFKTDLTGKSHDEVMKYYTDQKKQIMALDTAMNTAIAESNKFLSSTAKK